MNHLQHNKIVGFIWSIADDVLRDVYVRGKYRDIILPFTVLRRLDALLEPKHDKVVEMHNRLNEMQITNQEAQLRKVAGYPFYNTSPYTLKSLLKEPSNIRLNLENYLDGFSANVQDIISKFKLRNQLDTLEEANITFPLIQKFCSKQINLSPEPVMGKDGVVEHDGLSNLGMGYAFEELIRRFNEENNEEAGEHFTPREIIKLMTHLIFDSIKGKIKKGTYLIYDPACGSGGMLTEAENFAKEINPDATFHLYGQEVQPETYAICKADMLIKEEDPDKIAYGSTLSKDGFPTMQFDFMLSNPPYGKTWKTDKGSIVDGKEIIDDRFKVGIPRVSDGQLLFLMNMVSKMKKGTDLGSRIASVHNGSSLFTGDAGGGESEIRKYLFENDLVEAVIQLPNNMFYNTGITTYIWILNNKKNKERKGKVQLINASDLYQRLLKNLGSKNCELNNQHIHTIATTFLKFKESDISKIYPNDEFGYTKLTIERPLRKMWQLDKAKLEAMEDSESYQSIFDALQKVHGTVEHKDFVAFKKSLDKKLKAEKIKWTAKQKSFFLDAFSWVDEEADPIVKKKTKEGIEYEADGNLRDNEKVSLQDDIQAYLDKEVYPYVPDAWEQAGDRKVGYELSFTKVFYQYEPLRSLEAISADILKLEDETSGLLKEIVNHD